MATRKKETIAYEAGAKKIETENSGLPKEAKHYQHKVFGLEPISEMENLASREEIIGFCKCNVIKYLRRFKYKGNAKEDIKKAMQYSCWRYDLIHGISPLLGKDTLAKSLHNFHRVEYYSSYPTYNLGFFFYFVQLFNITNEVEKIILEIKEDLENG